MSEKLTAWLVTAAVIAPVCAACILGPAAIVSIFAGVVGWFGGLGAFATAGLVLVAGFSVYGLIRRRKAQRPPMPLSGELNDER
jgi:hypothetical protein